ncbi:MAG TPA: RICIN domain-containing protein [Mycobacteriales bacterium]|nr:RICIN domain-containing protein [Mycobacteriales bacterium]
MWTNRTRRWLRTGVLGVAAALATVAGLPGVATADSRAAPAALPGGFHTACALTAPAQGDCLLIVFGLTHTKVVPGVTTFDWVFIPAGAGAYYIRNRERSDVCVDILADSQADSAPVVTRTCDNTASQRWTYREDISGGAGGAYHPFINVWSGLALSFESVPDPTGPFPTAPVSQKFFGDRTTQYFRILAPVS